MDKDWPPYLDLPKYPVHKEPHEVHPGPFVKSNTGLYFDPITGMPHFMNDEEKFKFLMKQLEKLNKRVQELEKKLENK